MAQTTNNIFEEGFERVESTVKSIEKDFRSLQKRAEERRKELGKRAEREVKRLQSEFRKTPLGKQVLKRRTELGKRVDQLQNDLRKNAAVQRIEALRKDAEKALEEGVESVLGALQVAPKSEVVKLERKVNQLSRKVRELEKAAKAEAA